MKKKICPQCAESVNFPALICRFCHHEFEVLNDVESLTSTNKFIIGGVVATLLLVTGGAAFWSYGLGGSKVQVRPTATRSVAKDLRPNLIDTSPQDLSVGEIIEWQSAQGTIKRRLGIFVVDISPNFEDEFVAPVVTISDGTSLVTMTGESASPNFTHSFSSYYNRIGALPVFILQSFSGGAHCCNHVQIAGYGRGKLISVDMGSWDGDSQSLPRDLNGDGVADWTFIDNSFLYAFTAYAMSYAPPVIYNILDGKMVDVSRRPSFRSLFKESMNKTKIPCRTDQDGAIRNGACAAYVASAARTGQLEEAWADMLAAYAPGEDWSFPTGCADQKAINCPKGEVLNYKSYPEALLAFLKLHKYVSADWLPPETYMQSPVGKSPPPEVPTA